jgi:hypothetical protein
MVRDIEVPHIVQHDVTIEVPHIVQHDVVIEAPRAPMPTPNLVDRPAVDPSPSSVLPSKIPTAQEQDFVNQPDYQTAEFHGRIVGPSKDGGFVFDTGQKMRPGKIVNGKVAADNSVVEVVEPFIGDYAFCKRNVVDERVDCRVIHNGVVQKIPRKAAPQAKKVGANNPRPFGSENGM